MPAVLSGDMRFSVEDVDLKKVRRALTIKLWDQGKENVTIVKAYKRDHKYIHVPRQYGLAYAEDNNIPVKENVSDGFPIKGMKKLVLRERQDEFVEGLEDYFVSGLVDDCRVEAHTGFGKTVCSLEYIRRRGRTAIVFVDQKFLRDQWIGEAKDIFGLKDVDIGIIQGKVCDYEGKKLVIAMVQTLYDRKYEDQLYSYFGTVVFDECHTVGAEKFSRVLSQFNARVRFGISATPDRIDKLQKLLEYHLGGVDVVVDKKHKKSIVRYIEYDGVISWYANISPKNGRYITEISEDDRRNDLIVWVINWLYKNGRTVLVVSDRAEQIHNFRYMLRSKGVPEKDMGMVTTYDNLWKYAKDATPPRKPVGWVKGTEYTPVKLQIVKKKIPKAVLEDNKDNKRIVLSTYQMFTKGVNVPHLDSGVDATPRARAEQVHGRILRPKVKGKKIPLWVTFRDIMSYKAEFQFHTRIKEYEKSNAEIYQWHPRIGTRKVDTKKLLSEVRKRGAMLKESEIVMTPDGKNTVVMKTSASA